MPLETGAQNGAKILSSRHLNTTRNLAAREKPIEAQKPTAMPVYSGFIQVLRLVGNLLPRRLCLS
jgi:hypothetical protein